MNKKLSEAKLSEAAKKAWATRRKKYGKGGLRKSKVHYKKPKSYEVYTVEKGKVIAHTEPFIPKKPCKLYKSRLEAELVAKYGPDWYMKHPKDFDIQELWKKRRKKKFFDIFPMVKGKWIQGRRRRKKRGEHGGEKQKNSSRKPLKRRVL